MDRRACVFSQFFLTLPALPTAGKPVLNAAAFDFFVQTAPLCESCGCINRPKERRSEAVNKRNPIAASRIFLSEPNQQQGQEWHSRCVCKCGQDTVISEQRGATSYILQLLSLHLVVRTACQAATCKPPARTRLGAVAAVLELQSHRKLTSTGLWAN